jgi:hypothetical protein
MAIYELAVLHRSMSMSQESEEVRERVEYALTQVKDPEIRNLIASNLVEPSSHERHDNIWPEFKRNVITCWTVARHEASGTDLVYSQDVDKFIRIGAWGSFTDPDLWAWEDWTPTLEEALLKSPIAKELKGWNVVSYRDDGTPEVYAAGLHYPVGLDAVEYLNGEIGQEAYTIEENPQRVVEVGLWDVLKLNADGSRHVLASSLTYPEAFQRMQRINSHFTWPIYHLEKASKRQK